MTTEFLTEILSIPNPSGHEGFLIERIQEWCGKNGVHCKKDGHGNLYLTKGSAPAGGYMPGATAHLDSVHHDQTQLAKDKTLMEPKVEGDKVTMWIDGKQTGCGCDDKNAIAIILSLFTRVKALKAAFFVGEETGMQGAAASDMSFWDDVSWIFGCDSPGPASRATKACSGVRLYTDEFFDKYLGPICKKHGVTDFRFEPWTDEKKLIERGTSGGKKFICCCNINNGGYNAHSSTEYAKISEVNATEELGYELITSIPTDVRHELEMKNEYSSGYGGYGGYGSSYGGYGGRRSSWGSYWQDRYSARQSALGKSAGNGHDFTDVASFTWSAPDEEKAKVLLKQLEGFPKGMLTVTSNTGPVYFTTAGKKDVTTVTVKAQYRDLKFAYLAALNCETGKAYKNWWEMEKAEPDAARQFERVIRWEKPAASDDPMSKSFWTDWPSVSKEKKTPPGTSSDAALTITFKNETQVDRFLDRVQKEGIAVDVDDTVPDEVTVSGDLPDVKDAYVVAFNVLNKKGLREFWELSPAAKDRFWSNVVWGSGSDPDDADADEKPEGDDDDDVIDVDSEAVPADEKAASGEPKYDEGDLWDWYNSRQQGKK